MTQKLTEPSDVPIITGFDPATPGSDRSLVTLDYNDYMEAQAAMENLDRENERLKTALRRMLLEFDFLIESGKIPDIRNDVIFDNARAALEGKNL